MEERDTAERLLDATVSLLGETSQPEKVTARQIAKEADVNLAMINYFYKSKDNLVNLGIQQIVASETANFISVIDEEDGPKEQLYQVLNYFCEIAITYEQFLPLTVPYKLLKAEMDVPSEILEIVEAFYENRIPSAYCRMIGLQIMSFTELLLLRAENFKSFTGINILNKGQRQHYLRFQIELFLQAKSEE